MVFYLKLDVARYLLGMTNGRPQVQSVNIQDVDYSVHDVFEGQSCNLRKLATILPSNIIDEDNAITCWFGSMQLFS